MDGIDRTDEELLARDPGPVDFDLFNVPSRNYDLAISRRQFDSKIGLESDDHGDFGFHLVGLPSRIQEKPVRTVTIQIDSLDHGPAGLDSKPDRTISGIQIPRAND
jgi:hypothetical protein